MRIRSLGFLLIGCIASLTDTGYCHPWHQSSLQSALKGDDAATLGKADSADARGQGNGRTVPDARARRTVLGKNRSRVVVKIITPKPPKRLAIHQNAAAGKLGNARPSAVQSAATFGNNKLSGAALARKPVRGQINKPSLTPVRHRSPNPAIVGGPGSAPARGSSVLDGTHMNRRF